MRSFGGRAEEEAEKLWRQTYTRAYILFLSFSYKQTHTHTNTPPAHIRLHPHQFIKSRPFPTVSLSFASLLLVLAVASSSKNAIFHEPDTGSSTVPPPNTLPFFSFFFVVRLHLPVSIATQMTGHTGKKKIVITRKAPCNPSPKKKGEKKHNQINRLAIFKMMDSYTLAFDSKLGSILPIFPQLFLGPN